MCIRDSNAACTSRFPFMTPALCDTTFWATSKMCIRDRDKADHRVPFDRMDNTDADPLCCDCGIFCLFPGFTGSLEMCIRDRLYAVKLPLP